MICAKTRQWVFGPLNIHDLLLASYRLQILKLTSLTLNGFDSKQSILQHDIILISLKYMFLIICIDPEKSLAIKLKILLHVVHSLI